jgi:hypothetical protein
MNDEGGGEVGRSWIGKKTVFIDSSVKLPSKMAIVTDASLCEMYFSRSLLSCYLELNSSITIFLLESLIKARSSAKVNLLFLEVGENCLSSSSCEILFVSLEEPPHRILKYIEIFSLMVFLVIYCDIIIIRPKNMNDFIGLFTK